MLISCILQFDLLRPTTVEGIQIIQVEEALAYTNRLEAHKYRLEYSNSSSAHRSHERLVRIFLSYIFNVNLIFFLWQYIQNVLDILFILGVLICTVKRLTHLCLMECPVLIIWTNPFRIKGLLGSNFQSQFLKVHFVSKQCKT